MKLINDTAEEKSLAVYFSILLHVEIVQINHGLQRKKIPALDERFAEYF